MSYYTPYSCTGPTATPLLPSQDASDYFYGSTSATNQRAKQALYNYLDHVSEFHMSNEDEVLEYYHDFMDLIKPVIDSHCLSKQDHNRLFWHGFHPDNHEKLFWHLISKYPNQ